MVMFRFTLSRPVTSGLSLLSHQSAGDSGYSTVGGCWRVPASALTVAPLPLHLTRPHQPRVDTEPGLGTASPPPHLRLHHPQPAAASRCWESYLLGVELMPGAGAAGAGPHLGWESRTMNSNARLRWLASPWLMGGVVCGGEYEVCQTDHWYLCLLTTLLLTKPSGTLAIWQHRHGARADTWHWGGWPGHVSCHTCHNQCHGHGYYVQLTTDVECNVVLISDKFYPFYPSSSISWWSSLNIQHHTLDISKSQLSHLCYIFSCMC